MTADDMPIVASIATRVHPSLPERADVLAEKRRLFPGGCRKLVIGGEIRGYALAHPWTLCDPPALDTYLSALPVAADCLFIHDLAVLPEARGQGAAAAYIHFAELTARTQALPALALIAAYGTARLWSRFGFVASGASGLGKGAACKLADYGPEAQFLMRRLA